MEIISKSEMILGKFSDPNPSKINSGMRTVQQNFSGIVQFTRTLKRTLGELVARLVTMHYFVTTGKILNALKL